MYKLSDAQIDFILNDISARGVEMESLQLGLLDHICCIIEQNLEEGGDFGSFYEKTIRTFYKDELWELEEETLTLLTFKNYYTMKKLMIISGAAASVLLITGIWFKFMFWPGTSFFIVLGLLTASLVFLPLMFTLRIREKQQLKDKLTMGIGSLCCILISLHVLFKVMHWPYAGDMGVAGLAILGLVFLPVYFFSGIRNPETKVNTIVSSVLIVVGISLVLTLVRTPQSARIQNERLTAGYLRSQRILNVEAGEMARVLENQPGKNNLRDLGRQIYSLCEELKLFIVESETGSRNIAANFASKEALLTDSQVKDYFAKSEAAEEKLAALNKNVLEYNSQSDGSIAIQPGSVMEIQEVRSIEALNMLTQVQLFLLQNNRKFLAGR